MSAASPVDVGRTSYARQDWSAAYDQLSAADRETGLEPADLQLLAVAAYLVGKGDESRDSLSRAFRLHVDRGESDEAVRCAFWLFFLLVNAGEQAQAGGWVARAHRVHDAGHEDCVERGYLLLPAALEALFSGELDLAQTTFGAAAEIGAQHRDPDITTLARMGQGQALLFSGHPLEGMALLDEAMVAVTSEEVSPLIAGLVYCAVIIACQQTFDLRRAREWTAALSTWCEPQHGLVPYRGQCLVHRAEIMQLHGSWPEAMDEAERARSRLGDPPGQPAIGMAHYQLGELHRLRGAFATAEECYRSASQQGHDPQPGLGLLRLAQGQPDAARAMIARTVDEGDDRQNRVKLLAAYVEILLATGDVAGARVAADDLTEGTSAAAPPWPRALAAEAQGRVLLAAGDARGSLEALRRAWRTWRDLEMPYHAARARVLIGQACQALGDEDGAELELDAGRWVFQQLGARPDLAWVEGLSRRPGARTDSGLTVREVQVVRLVATGRTNRAIATELFLSEKTVARHLSNIFTKLGLSSRAAATAYAYEHDLV